MKAIAPTAIDRARLLPRSGIGVDGAWPGGRLLQAAMGLLVVAAEERAAAGEDVALLSKRIADYEAWSGHTAGR